MTWTVFVYGFIPLLVFVLVDLFASLKWAVIAAIVFAAGDVILSYYTLQALDPGSVMALVLLVGLGVLALRKGDRRWVKLQPVILAVAFALFVGYFQFFGQPILDRYLPLIRAATPAEFQSSYDNPLFMTKMNQAITGLIFVFLLHGALVAWAAYRLSSVAWLLIRGLGFWVLLFMMTVGVMLS